MSVDSTVTLVQSMRDKCRLVDPADLLLAGARRAWAWGKTVNRCKFAGLCCIKVQALANSAGC